LYTHEHSNGHPDHFRWCPDRGRKIDIRACLCDTAIYGGMGILGGITAYAEYTLGEIAQAASPRADALHVAGDTASDLAVFIVSILAVIIARTARSASSEKRVWRVGAYVQAALLAVAAIFIGNEFVEKILNPQEVNPWIIVGAGLVGVIGNGIRLAILHLKAGRWNINRFIQDRHVRTDLYYSALVSGAGMLILTTGWHWVDFFPPPLIFGYVSRMAWISFKDAWQGKVYDHHH